MNVVSLFSGAGGFDLAFERAGARVVGQVEIDPTARDVLARHYPTVPRMKDVRNVRGNEFGTADVLVGGFPCQDVSVAGRRAGLAGERSGLWFEFHRIVAAVRPQWVAIENVPGLLSSHAGRDFATVVSGLVECGYRVAWRVLDAQHFGVPQRRRRLFIVASLGDGRAAQVLFERDGSERDTASGKKAQREAESRAGEGAGTGGGVAKTLTAKNRLSADDTTFVVVGTPTARNPRSMGLKSEKDFQIVTTSSVRILTPVEYERLQGFPDGWTAMGASGRVISDTARYRLMGNAVAVPVVEWIARRMEVTGRDIFADIDILQRA